MREPCKAKTDPEQRNEQGKAALPRAPPGCVGRAPAPLLDLFPPPFIEIICTSKSLNKAAAPGGLEQAGRTRDLG